MRHYMVSGELNVESCPSFPFLACISHMQFNSFVFKFISSVYSPLCSKPSSHSGQVSGQQRKEEPEAAPGVGPQAPLQPGVPGSDQHLAAGPRNAAERDNPLHPGSKGTAQTTSP